MRTAGSRMPDGQPLAAQPAWRREFPVDAARESMANRRQFLRSLVVASGGFACGQLALYVTAGAGGPMATQSGPRMRIAQRDELAPGQARLFHYPSQHEPCLLIHLPPERAATAQAIAGHVAFSQRCTHLACPVQPRVEFNELFCPCHNGRFDLSTGAPTGGPPKRPLPRIRLELVDGAFYAIGIDATVSG